MKNNSILCFLLLFIFCTFEISNAADSEPLLPAKEVVSSIPTIDQAIEAMYVSSDVLTVPKELEGRLFAAPDLSQVEIQAIDEVIAAKNNKKEIVYIRYTNGDLRIVDALIRAKQAGVKVTIITDFNTVMKGSFAEGQIVSTDFDKAEMNRDSEGKLEEGARAIQTLIENGFTIGKDLLSQPLYKETENSRVPIMHIKGMITFVGEKIETWFGTNNASRNQRYNRLFKVVDQQFGLEFLSYLRDLTVAFKAEKPITATPPRPPVLIRYQDGTSLQISFTQGRFNTNDDQVNLLKTAQLREIYASHFAPAYNGLVQAIYENMQTLSPTAKMRYVVDDRFGGPNGWGAMLRLSGFNVLLPFGKMIYGVKEAVAKRVDGWIYQRYSLDPETGKRRIEKNQDGPPEERHVWHDKTTLFLLKEGGAYIFSGSFNASGNYKNAEIQARFATSDTSWLVSGVRHSIDAVIEKEQGVWAISAYEATVRNSLAALTGHTDLEVPIDVVRDLIEAFRNREYDKVSEAILKMLSIESELDKKLSRSEVKFRIDSFLTFYRWYLKSADGEKSFADWRLRRLTLIPFLLSESNLTNYAKFSLMESVIWKPDMWGDEESKNRMVLEGLAALGITGVSVPKKKEPRTPRAKVEVPKAVQDPVMTCSKYFAA